MPEELAKSDWQNIRAAYEAGERPEGTNGSKGNQASHLSLTMATRGTLRPAITADAQGEYLPQCW